jgi:transposase
MSNSTSNTWPAWNQRKAFAALDWAKGKHQIVVVNNNGEVILKFSFAHTSDGWAKFREKIVAWPGLAIVLELSSGLIVEQLIATGLTVYGINPACTAAYRQRKVPSGTKDDEIDAWTLAEALRQDGSGWSPLVLPSQACQELALLTRDEVALIEQRTALINRLQATLLDYYPVLLEAFDDWTVPSTWDFVAKFPTPQKLLKAGPRQWKAFLHVHCMWRENLGPKRLALFAKADQLCASGAIVSAKSFLASKLVEMLRLLETQLKNYRRQIQLLFDQHPERALFESLPGAGPKLAPRLLAEISGKLDPHGPQSLQCRVGTAPVRFQSGKINKAHIRRACDHHLRCIVHQWCDHSRRSCAWAEVYYQAHRKKGQSHACALRCLGQRWLNILYKMLKTHTPYNEALHTQNQLKHGSWIFKLQQP